jgi:undecaprenyl diphosphate synthase
MYKLLVVKGRVQGVTYRKFVKELADTYGYFGYVQNQSDGSVFVLITNPDKYFEKFVERISIGSKFSIVNSIKISSDTTIQETFSNFSIIKSNNIILDQANSMKNLIKTILQKPEINDKPIHHIAIIPDGNRRWAKAKGLPVVIGHKVSSDFAHILDFLEVGKKYNIDFVTIWAFSTENWKRPIEEVDYLMKLLIDRVVEGKEILMEKNIVFKWLGNPDKLSDEILKDIKMLEDSTKNNTGMTIQLALNYGGRDEIISAVNRTLDLGIKKVTDEEFDKILNVNNIPNPDIIVRTGGENRLSGFMLFNCGYSELFFTKTLFPDFGTLELESIIKEYYNRKRNFGK